MAKHRVYVDLNIDMDEMDGEPEESAEVLLDLPLLQEIRELCEAEGFPAELHIVHAEDVSDV